MNPPEPYRRFYRTHLRFALVMILVALLAGICFQESAGRKVPVTASLPVGAHLEFVLDLALVHGHIFLAGVLLPLAFTWMLHLALALGCEPVPGRSLAWTTALYLPGALLSILLLLLKGYHLVLGVRHGALDYPLLDKGFLGGSHALRAGAYGLAHGAMALGLGVLGTALWRTLMDNEKA